MRVTVSRFVSVFGLLAWLTGASPGTAQVVFGGQVSTPPSNVPPEQRCTVSGQVTNALTGEAVKRANLRLIAQRSGGQVGTIGFAPGQGMQGYTAASDNDGNFQFENVEPGTYTLTATRQGFLMASFGARSRNQPGTPITLAPAQARTGITMALTPQAVIAGKVLDEEGEPAANVNVQVMASDWYRGKVRYMMRGGTNTNDLGEFRAANLSPGKYYLIVQKFMGGEMAAPSGQQKADIRPVRTYYPGVTTLDAASTLEVRAGQDLTGIEIKLQTAPTYHVRGKVGVQLSDELKQRGSVALQSRSAGNFFMPVAQSQIKPDGTFDIAGVPAGSYVATMFQMGRDMRSSARVNVDVGAGDVTDLVLAPAPMSSLHGKITIEGNPSAGNAAVNFKSVHIGLNPADFGMGFGGMPRANIGDDGTFTVNDITPNAYNVSVTAPRGTYVKSVLFGQTDVKDKELDLSGGGGGELDIVLRYGSAELDGVLQPAAAAQIILVPQAEGTDQWNIRQGNADNSGAFSIKEVPPGKYTAYALEQIDFNQLQNPAVLKALEAKGTAVELRENDRKQLTLPLVPTADVQDLLSRAGVESQ